MCMNPDSRRDRAVRGGNRCKICFIPFKPIIPKFYDSSFLFCLLTSVFCILLFPCIPSFQPSLAQTCMAPIHDPFSPLPSITSFLKLSRMVAPGRATIPSFHHSRISSFRFLFYVLLCHFLALLYPLFVTLSSYCQLSAIAISYQLGYVSVITYKK